MFKVEGVIKRIADTEQVTEKFSKREFVVEIPGEYPQTVLFQTVQDKTKMLDDFGAGETVEVSFNLRGREWTNPNPKKGENPVRVFNTLDAWRVELVSQNADSNGNSAQAETVAETEEEDDVPF
jgi:hypothetical protein